MGENDKAQWTRKKFNLTLLTFVVGLFTGWPILSRAEQGGNNSAPADDGSKHHAHPHPHPHPPGSHHHHPHQHPHNGDTDHHHVKSDYANFM